MSFFGMLTDTISTQRLKYTSNTNSSYKTNLTGQPCLIQPVSPEFAAKTGFAFGKSFKCFLPIGTDIVMSDKVTDEFGNLYTVTGSLNRPYGMNTQNLQVILEQQAGQGYQQ
jgi:hypothetical protein